MPAVVVKTGPEAGKRVEVGLEVAIGRQDGDLVLEDPEVSRSHALLRGSGGSVVVEDLDSTNGTFVNGKRIQGPTALGHGDQVRIGRTTLEVELDQRAQDTIASIPMPPDQVRSAEPPASDVLEEHEDATKPLPGRALESASRPERRNGKWIWVGAAALVVLSGVIAYAALVDRSAENGFAGAANDACETVQRSGVELGRTPTRGELQRARNARLQALGAIRALGRPEDDAALVDKFVAAFRETNASITRLEGAIGAGNHEVARAVRILRGNVGDERELAVKAGIAGCGGLAIG